MGMNTQVRAVIKRETSEDFPSAVVKHLKDNNNQQ